STTQGLDPQKPLPRPAAQLRIRQHPDGDDPAGILVGQTFLSVVPAMPNDRQECLSYRLWFDIPNYPHPRPCRRLFGQVMKLMQSEIIRGLTRAHFEPAGKKVRKRNGHGEFPVKMPNGELKFQFLVSPHAPI